MGSKREAKLQKKENKKKKNKMFSLKSDPSPLVPESHGEDETAVAGGRKVVTDPRFSSVHVDPRFREAPKHKTKVAIDSRFDRLFKDKGFLPSSAPVNKRGKPQKRNTQQGSLRHYYRTEEVEKKVDDDHEKEVQESSEEEDEEERKREELAKPNRVKPGDEEGGESEPSEEENQDETDESESSTDIDEDEDEGVYDQEMPGMQEEVPQIEKETHRLAVVNMDWRYVKAVDLYVLLSSFVPPNGQIKSVAVYPSEFGLQRMKEEEVHGPVGLFDDDDDANSDGDSSDDDIDNEKLRAYEKSRLRYYYAVVECDSSTTADYIYKECDGLEFIQSSNALDLRFIPDSMEFKHPPHDVATEAPPNYEFKHFYTRALQHSKVNLSWDEDEPIRMRTLKRKFNDEQLAEMELKEFLNSDESESDDDEETNEAEDKPDKTEKREKYRALLQSGDGSDEDGEDDGQDMEVTFNTGLEDISKRILEKRDKQSETVWEAYLRKRREKKKARKNKSKNSSDDDSGDTDQEATEEAEDDFFIDEHAVKNSKAQSKNDKTQKHQDMDGGDKASKEELELLLADDKGTVTGIRGYNSKFKKGKGKGKRGSESVDEGKLPSTNDIDDPRFSDFFSKPDFALDPTDPQFKRSAAYARQLARKQQKRDMDSLAEEEHVKASRVMPLSSDHASEMKGEKNESDVFQSKKQKYELSSLVKSIKMKSKQVQLPSDGKKKRDGKLQFKVKEKNKH